MPDLIPVDHDPFAPPTLIPVDHDPFASDQVHVPPQEWRLPDLAALTGMPSALEQSATATAANPWQPGMTAGQVLAGRPDDPLAGSFQPGVGVGAIKPITAALKGQDFIDSLRAAHLARDDAIPLSGAKMPIAPPEHIKTPEDLQGLVGRYADLAQAGEVGRDWYNRSGQEILESLGGNKDLANAFVAGLARTSPQTDVAANATHALTIHNQAMAGDPLAAGRFPQAMGGALTKTYYEGQPISGEKIGPFNSAVAQTWNPDLGHTFVNDIWNMRANEYPGKNGRLFGAGTDEGSVSLGQHNFTRVIANLAADELKARTGMDWSPEQTQAAVWTGIKSKTEGTDPRAAAFDFADALRRNYAQASWESAPGLTTGHFPEFHDAPLEQRQAYHDAVRNVLTDENGRDIIQQHLGMLTGPSIDAPGVFQGRINPGSQSQVSVGAAPGGWKTGVDPASQSLLNAAEMVRGLLLRQDAVAWHKPTFSPQLRPQDANMVDVRMGRPLTENEALAVTNAMHDATGTDFHSPIGTPQGFRFLNVPEYSGVNNRAFQAAAEKVVDSDAVPGEASLYPAKADSFYTENNWQENPNGQDYLQGIAGTGRPHVERAAAELLATLGPRIGKVEEDFARHFGWTPNRESRVWEQPDIARHAKDVIPTPTLPWLRRTNQEPLRLIPVEHDPFAEAAQ